MFSSIKIGILLALLAAAGMGFLYVKKLQSDLETSRQNAARLEVAVQTSEASLRLERAETKRLENLNSALTTELRNAEKYGDELRDTLQRHNLTHLASKKPGLIEKSMQGSTDELWKDLESITSSPPAGVQPTVPGTGNTGSN